MIVCQRTGESANLREFVSVLMMLPGRGGLKNKGECLPEYG
jgi:hypothetical protein